MSFSSNVKEELQGKIDSAVHCRLAEFAALTAFSKTVLPDACKNQPFTISMENSVVKKKWLALAEQIFGIRTEQFVCRQEGNRSSVTQIVISDDSMADRILMALKWTKTAGGEITPVLVPPLLVQKECCKRAFIRGAFLAAGSISDPHKFYHFEMVCSDEEGANQLKDMLLFFHLDAKVIIRKKNFVVYLKEGNHITDCLNVMGAYVSQMNLYNVMILKGISNDVNRKVNCETANLNKTIEAAVKQIRDIEYIRDTIGLEALSDGLRQVAYLRLENTDMNLKDIGERLDPPVGKSGVNHRLRKLGMIADDLRKK